jgi:hypothetical protein
MVSRQLSQLDPPVEQEGCAGYDEGVRSLAHKSGEGSIEFEAGAGVENLDLQPQSASSCSHVSQCRVSSGSIGRIDEHGNTNGPGHQRTQEFQSFCRQLPKNVDSRQVTAWPGEARNKTKADRVYADKEDDWDRGGCRLCCERGRDTSCGDHRDPSLHQFRRQRWQPIGLIVGRVSMATFSPSMKPASFKPWRNARRRKGSVDDGWTNPTTGIAGCCARAASGHTNAAPPSTVMNARRFTRLPDQRRRGGSSA